MLSVAQVSETVLVEGVTPPAVTSTQTSANITAAEVNALPMGRTPYLIAELMPGVTTNTPSPNQLTISGGFAYDNVFLIDGVDVNDNLLGTVNDLYIEDAIGEVQVLTSGVSARNTAASRAAWSTSSPRAAAIASPAAIARRSRVPRGRKETPFETQPTTSSVESRRPPTRT